MAEAAAVTAARQEAIDRKAAEEAWEAQRAISVAGRTARLAVLAPSGITAKELTTAAVGAYYADLSALAASVGDLSTIGKLDTWKTTALAAL